MIPILKSVHNLMSRWIYDKKARNDDVTGVFFFKECIPFRFIFRDWLRVNKLNVNDALQIGNYLCRCLGCDRKRYT